MGRRAWWLLNSLRVAIDFSHLHVQNQTQLQVRSLHDGHLTKYRKQRLFMYVVQHAISQFDVYE